MAELVHHQQAEVLMNDEALFLRCLPWRQPGSQFPKTMSAEVLVGVCQLDRQAVKGLWGAHGKPCAARINPAFLGVFLE